MNCLKSSIILSGFILSFSLNSFGQCPFSFSIVSIPSICEPQTISVRLVVTSSSSDWIDGEVKWFLNGSVTPSQSSGIFINSFGQTNNVDFSFYAQQGTTVSYTVSDAMSSCSSGGSFSISLSAPLALNQVYARYCDDGKAKIRFSTNNTSATSEYQLYYYQSINDPSMGLIPGYTLVSANSSGYFEISDFNMPLVDSYFVKVTGTCPPTTFTKVAFETAPNVSGLTQTCQGAGIIITASSATNSFNWFNDIGTIVSQSNSLTIPNSQQPGNYVFSVKSVSPVCNSIPKQVSVIVIPKPVNGMLQSSSSAICIGQSVTISSNGGIGSPYYWASTNGGQTWNVFQEQFIGQASFQFTPTEIGTYRFRLKNKTDCGFCLNQSDCMTEPYIDVVVGPLPTNGTIASNKTAIYLGESVTISSSGGIGTPYYSCNKLGGQSSDGFVEQFIGQSSFIHTPTSVGTFRYTLKNRNNCGFCSDFNSCTSLPYIDVVVSLVNNYNFIRETTVNVSGKQDFESVNVLSIGDKNVTTSYFDGLGRLMQTVGMKASPSNKDFVQITTYDLYGRTSKVHLPVTTNTIDGWYKPNLTDGMGNFVNSQTFINPYSEGMSNKISSDLRPFSETIFEPSPLNRPIQSFGPGQQWKDNDKAISHGYFVNIHGSDAGQERIVFWEIVEGVPVKSALNNSSVSGGYYLSGQLSIKSTKDEHGSEVREYINKEGKTILKKVQVFAGSAQINIDSHWAQTYYIYDDLGNLIMVLPPEAVKALTN